MAPRVLHKWYFCLNARGFDFGLPLVKIAVSSARANTDLSPHCIYAGSNPDHVAQLRDLGITVVSHKSSLDRDLRTGYGSDYSKFDGHWLRVDLPDIERHAEFVLYSDIDVMFLGPPVVSRWPRLIAAAPQDDRSERRYFNSGVMILNLPGLRRVQNSFKRAIQQRLNNNFIYPAHDQESYNRFFGPSWKNRLLRRSFCPLDERNNWKPYWGIHKDARIVHFHGPKARDIRVFSGAGGQPEQEYLLKIWRRNTAAYAHYSDLSDSFHPTT